jgi:hypothetical protein
MAGALGIEQALEDGDRMGRGHADGLVENHPAMDVAAITLLLAALALLFASPAAGADRYAARAAEKLFSAGVFDRRFAARARCLEWSHSSVLVRICLEVFLNRRCSQ